MRFGTLYLIVSNPSETRDSQFKMMEDSYPVIGSGEKKRQ